jgi:hypothetical protein
MYVNQVSQGVASTKMRKLGPQVLKHPYTRISNYYIAGIGIATRPGFPGIFRLYAVEARLESKPLPFVTCWSIKAELF